MAELQELADLQATACDPSVNENCDLTQIIEALKGLSDIADPFEQLRQVSKSDIVLANIVVGVIPLLQIIAPIILWYTWQVKVATR